MKFSRPTQDKIFKALLSTLERIFENSSSDGMSFLSEIWNLREMPSKDGRFIDAYGDIFQHYINNSDLSTEQLFLDRLTLYNNPATFQSFVEKSLSPKYFDTPQQLTTTSFLVDSALKDDNLRLVIEEYDQAAFPIQKIYEIEEVGNLPDGIKKNNIPFYLSTSSQQERVESQYFLLSPNTGWNDYKVVSIFSLSYIASGITRSIGYIKIIHYEELHTWKLLPSKFYQLPEDYCSLGREEDYYFILRDIFRNTDMISILFALQDSAYFSDIHDRFEKRYNFIKSLLRDDGAERLLREIRAKLDGISISDLYSFNYNFHPAYSEIPIKVNFDFNNDPPLPNRIFAIIGKNGTGKTQLITSLPNDFSKKNRNAFFNKIPAFSKIIAVSYSVFDNFSIPRKNATFNYVYCGLKNEKGEMRSSQGLLLSFHNNWKRIAELDRTERWRSILLNFIDQNIVDSFIVMDTNFGKYQVNISGFSKIKEQFSSGQSILLYIITEVVANIRFDSLILYDEPETHLHPNAIVQLMNTLYELVEEFESFCIIATHSPIVIRELFSKNVYVMERNMNFPSLRRIGLECFGENLGILSDEVFGDREVQKQYKKIIIKQVEQGKSFDEIVDLLEFDEYPLSLNARIYIKNILRNEKH